MAVVAVIVNHFDKGVLPSGHLGVDVFFVISGFVISASLHGRNEDNLRSMLLGFYARRVRRLLPALLACITLTALLACLFDPDPRWSLRTGIAALFGVSNIYLWDGARDYFGRAAELNPFTHTWSLGVEEQFYLLFPLIAWTTRFARTGDLRAFVWTVASCSAVSLAGYLAFSANRVAVFYLMPARFWELGAGCLAYAILAARGSAGLPVRPRWLSAALLGLVCAAFAAPAELSRTPTALAVGATAGLLLLLSPGTVGHRVLSAPAAVHVGKISYSLYLWHWSVIVISRWTIGIHWWSVPFQVAAMLALAAFSYHRVERPLRHARNHMGRSKVIGYGVLATGVAVCAVGVLAAGLARQFYAGTPPALLARGVSSLLEPHTVDGSTWSGAPCVLSEDGQVGKALQVEECTLGDFAAADRRILVVGNSFSAAFVHGFDELVAGHDHAVTITSSWDASPTPNIENHSEWARANDYYWQDVVPSLTGRLRPGDALFLVNDLASFSPIRATPGSGERLHALRAGLETIAGELRARGVGVYVLGAVPFARDANCDPSLGVRQWFSPFGGPCTFYTRQETLGRSAALTSMLASLERAGTLRVVDVFDVFCPRETCTYEAADGRVLYRDEWSHPSVEAVRLAAPVIRRAFLDDQDERRPGHR